MDDHILCEFRVRTGREPVCTHDCKGCMFYNDPDIVETADDDANCTMPSMK